MQVIQNFADIIDLYPNHAVLAAVLGVRESAVTNMRARRKISGRHFHKIVTSAREMGHEEITHELLCQLADHPAEREAVAA